MNAPQLSDLENALIDTLDIIQRMSGRASILITGNTVPIGDLAGFDSLTGVEATSLIAERFHCTIKPSKKDTGANIFVSLDGRRALSVNEIATRLQPLIQISTQ